MLFNDTLKSFFRRTFKRRTIHAQVCDSLGTSNAERMRSMIMGSGPNRFLVHAPTGDAMLSAEEGTSRIEGLFAEGNPRMRAQGVELGQFLKKELTGIVGENAADELALKIVSNWFGNEMGHSAAVSSPLNPMAFTNARRRNPTEFAPNRGAPMTGTESVYRARESQLGRESVFQTEADILENMNVENSRLWDTPPDGQEMPTNDRAATLGNSSTAATMAANVRKHWASANGEPVSMTTDAPAHARAASKATSVRAQAESINEANKNFWGSAA